MAAGQGIEEEKVEICFLVSIMQVSFLPAELLWCFPRKFLEKLLIMIKSVGFTSWERKLSLAL